MAHKWIKTKYPGVRYREHPTRKHGVGPDKYFAIRYQANGVRKEESLGWASAGWTPQNAAEELARLKRAARLGEGPTRLSEAREKQKTHKRAQEVKKKRDITFKGYWERHYFPDAKISKKSSSTDKEFQHYRDWLKPALEDAPLRRITPEQLTDLRNDMLNQGKALRTVQHVFSTFRLVWNHAKRRGVVRVESPTQAVKLGKIQNERTRFLSSQEMKKLLDTLQTQSELTHDLALAALCTGARAGELFGLTWGKVDLDNEEIMLTHTKTGEPRTIPMLPELKDMLKHRGPGSKSDYVFQDQKGQKLKMCPSCFYDVAKELFNKEVTDRREKVCFHSLRHTAASHMLKQGVDLRTIQELFGWSTLQMLQRYSHVVNDTKRAAIRGLGRAFQEQPAKVIPLKREANGEQ